MHRHSSPQVQHVTVHGHRRAYVQMGSGPALLLLHGLGCDHTTWAPVMESLARTHTVIAPDLLGHGESDKPRADYSLGGYANGMRDLLTVLGIDRVTVVGHSFGGGVAMQFAYQFPERARATRPRVVRRARPGGVPGDPGHHDARLPPGDVRARGARPAARDHGGDAAAGRHRREPAARPRRGRRHLRLVQGPAQARRDRATSCARWSTGRARSSRWPTGPTSPRRCRCAWCGAPTTWSSRSRTPATRAPSRRRRGSRSSPTPGHFPHKDHPERFTKIVRDFIRTTEPSHYDRERWRDLLEAGAAVAPIQAEAGESPLTPVHTVRRAAGA